MEKRKKNLDEVKLFCNNVHAKNFCIVNQIENLIVGSKCLPKQNKGARSILLQCWKIVAVSRFEKAT